MQISYKWISLITLDLMAWPHCMWRLPEHVRNIKECDFPEPDCGNEVAVTGIYVVCVYSDGIGSQVMLNWSCMYLQTHHLLELALSTVSHDGCTAWMGLLLWNLLSICTVKHMTGLLKYCRVGLLILEYYENASQSAAFSLRCVSVIVLWFFTLQVKWQLCTLFSCFM